MTGTRLVCRYNKGHIYLLYSKSYNGKLFFQNTIIWYEAIQKHDGNAFDNPLAS